MSEFEFMGRDFDRELTDDERTWLESWNQNDLLARHVEVYGDGSQSEEDEVEGDDYDSWKLKELQEEAKNRQITGYSSMNTEQAIAALRKWDVENPVV